MAFKDPNKEIRWFWKTELNEKKTQEKMNQKRRFYHLIWPQSVILWGKSNKGNDNRNDNKNRKPRFNGECNNCVK